MRLRIERITQKIYTGSLLSKSYIQSQKPLGIPLSNQQPWLQTTNPKGDLEPFKKTHLLWQTTHYRSQNTLCICTKQVYSIQERKGMITPNTDWIQKLQSNPIPLLEKIQSLKQSWKNLIWKQSCESITSLKQIIYTPIGC